ncbi:hypothetical protein CYFUS_003207 [Cystobacter fuscus]|uniref:Lipoprotein n=1 Tax=Cystobacter fuscus TaxID=43 RepID=A0A250J2N7_9BACT|nr:hypothetical protein [Cystobacter fuscus]ATB37782.1 hypothetical protein CYFUS_003207 [Cystobacter fuscus]
MSALSELAVLSKSQPFPVPPSSYPLPVDPDMLAVLMPTPRPGAVAAILLDDTLRLVQLGDTGASLTKVAKNYIPMVSAGNLEGVSPAVLPDTCAYLQSRSLILYNLAQKQPQLFMVTHSLDESATWGRWLSVEPRRLAVQFRDMTNYLDTDTVQFRLRVLDVTGPEAKKLGELDLGTSGDFEWDAGNGVLVLWQGQQVRAYGPDLVAPIEHPLLAALGGLLSASLLLDELRLHPTRPLAVFTVRGNDPTGKDACSLWRATWAEGEAKLVPLAGYSSLESVRLGEFAPEGGWLAYSSTSKSLTRFYVQQVEATPGPPFALGSVENVDLLCWTRAPLALAALAPDTQTVTRWNFGRLPAAKGADAKTPTK